MRRMAFSPSSSSSTVQTTSGQLPQLGERSSVVPVGYEIMAGALKINSA